MFREVGCTEVSTYIQSGNVVFQARADLARRVPELLREGIRRQFDIDSPVVTRTVVELADVARSNPFLTLRKGEIDPKTLHVAFLLDQPTQEQITALDPDRSPPDEFIVAGREIYLRFPTGLARSKLTNQYFDSRLKTTSTVRGWRTVLKLLELTGGTPQGQ